MSSFEEFDARDEELERRFEEYSEARQQLLARHGGFVRVDGILSRAVDEQLLEFGADPKQPESIQARFAQKYGLGG